MNRCFVASTPGAAATQVFIVGNEAADVDSLVSAYAMAQLLNSSEVQAIALAQIPREEFHLRGGRCEGLWGACGVCRQVVLKWMVLRVSSLLRKMMSGVFHVPKSAPKFHQVPMFPYQALSYHFFDRMPKPGP